VARPDHHKDHSKNDVERFNNQFVGAASTDSHPVQVLEPHHQLRPSINLYLRPSIGLYALVISWYRIAALGTNIRFVLSSLTPFH
jgi:hypothetical protein